jgi:hypothetical protein
MIAVTPLVITDINLISSNVPEPSVGEAAWVAAANYTLGQEVIRVTTHKKYKNILAGADAGLPELTPTRWVESGVTNKFSMFDQYRNTQTVAASPLVVTVSPAKRINSFVAIGMEGDTLNVKMMQGATEIYNFTQNLSTRIVTNYYEYCYAEFGTKPSFAQFDLPPASNGIVTMTLSSPTGSVKCGSFIIGNQTYIGALRYGAKIGALNFSRIERAFDGSFNAAALVPRPSKPRVVGQLFSEIALTDTLMKLRSDLDGVPAAFSGLDDESTDQRFAALLFSGILRNLEPSLDYPDTNLVDIEIEEI